MSATGPRGLVGLLLSFAVRRWPATLRDEQCREWTAELAVLGGQPRSTWRRTRFVTSLAFGPTPDGGRDLRELLPGLGGRLRPALGFAVLSLLTLQLVPLEFFIDGRGYPLAWYAVVALPIAFVLGRRSRFEPSPALFGAVVAGAGLGFVAHRAVQIFWAPLWTGSLVAALVFVAAMTVALTGGLRLAKSGRNWFALALAIGGAALAVAAASGVGMLLNPATLPVATGKPTPANPVPSAWEGTDPVVLLFTVRFARSGVALWAPNSIGSYVPAFVALALLLLVFGVGAAVRRRIPELDVSSATEQAAWRPQGTLRVVGVLAIVVGLLSWLSVDVAQVLAGSASMAMFDGGLLTIDGWPQRLVELRWAAVLLTTAGLYAFTAARRAPGVAALLLGGWLLVVDGVLTRTSWVYSGWSTLAVPGAAAAFGLMLALWVAGRRIVLTADRAISIRRGLAVMAVTAAVCGPLLGLHADAFAVLPVGTDTAMVAVPAALVLLAVVAAAAARPRLLPVAAVAVLAAVPAGAITALVHDTVTARIQEPEMTVSALATGPFGVAVAALAFGRGRSGPLRTVAAVAAWCGAALLAVAVVPVALYASVVPSLLLSALSGVRYTEAFSFMPGAVIIATAATAGLARRRVRGTPTDPGNAVGAIPAVGTGPSGGGLAAPAGA